MSVISPLQSIQGAEPGEDKAGDVVMFLLLQAEDRGLLLSGLLVFWQWDSWLQSGTRQSPKPRWGEILPDRRELPAHVTVAHPALSDRPGVPEIYKRIQYKKLYFMSKTKLS